MNTQEIWSIAGAIVTSVGGAGFIICAVSGFVASRLAKRLDAKYDEKLNEKLERYKLTLEKHRYITKTQFGNEFEIYHLLSKAYFSMIVTLSSFTQNSFELRELPDENRKMKIDEFMTMGKSVAMAQNTLYENAAFIPANLFKQYESIYEKTISLFWEYQENIEEFAVGKCTLLEVVSFENKKIMEEINQEFLNLNTELRDYLDTLAIVE